MWSRPPVLAVCLLAAVSTTGCLGDDIWREPYVWRTTAEAGENQDAATAFAAIVSGLADQGTGQGDVVIGTAEDLPEGAAFQNAREFLERNAPGSGDQVYDGATVVVGTVADAYVQLTGPAADAYEDAVGPLAGTDEPIAFEVAERATRVRWTLDVVVDGPAPPEPGQNPTPVGAFAIRILSPDGAVKADYDIDTTRSLSDQVVEGTFGDRSEVRSHLGGTWLIEVSAPAQGAWSLVVEAYEPEFDDWDFWQFWRADPREGT